ncbi:MAG: aminotransferase class I/II-fold pyridoxal phosphate-dependent enzyme [Anaerolineales bacterium]|nr:aminotransferase class I/II-fold pyridoxal phosphate-dependent enzyme [Anaerolineales bacterium]
MKLNSQLEQLRQSATVALADRMSALLASGEKIIPLHVGDPDFGTPRAVLDVAHQAMQDGLTHYVSSRGLPDFRSATAAKLLRDSNLSYNPESEIIATHGGIHAYYLALQAILEPNDDVLVPDPSWPTHSNMVRLLRGNVIRVPAPAENGFIPPMAAWQNALTEKTRAIVINYPANPTGAYPDRAYLQHLQDFAAAHQLWVISDEVYENIYYGEKPLSAASLRGAKERTIIINSLSKTYAMTGWRIGFLAAPARVVEHALKAGQNSITCVAPFVQKAAAFALTDPGVQQAAATMRKAYARRRESVLRISREYGMSPVRVIPPQGAFYFYLDLRALGRASAELSKSILEATHVGVVSGSAFGQIGEGFVRMTIAASDADVEIGFRAILDWAAKQVGGQA